MSQPIAPKPPAGGVEIDPPTATVSPDFQKARKISTACGACKQRKTKCSGGTPCEACAARNSQCEYDASSDQRRKIASQRNAHDLAEAQHSLERCRQLLGGMVAIFRAASADVQNDLISFIRADTDLSSMAAYVRNEVRANQAVEQAFQYIDFHIDGPSESLPSPAQLLRRLAVQVPNESSESSSGMNTDPALS